ncbi:hypothetical protein ADIARSV_1039 [Arcticibacter svalbardensis MN12-7]|uniref:Uncharacterized protein n=1 Tax=Arcticibacter svalbardensis MN12-7 TaxID=1150600 RepID=R9GVH8_9SPHI|nr:hypothetical protein ADIARSV_1039 [Arcticibacter svalbardensis MN12-7]
MERSGIPVVSVFMADKNQAVEMMLSDTESSSKSLEKLNESSPLNEFWTAFNKYRSLTPYFRYLINAFYLVELRQHLTYIPSVLTPPPDYS